MTITVHRINDHRQNWQYRIVNGDIEVCVFGYYRRDQILDKLADQIKAPMLPAGVYVRFTANKNELKLLNARVLRPSYNVRDNYSEAGLSVADGYHYSMTGLPYYYLVSGEVVGHGSDGEPILAMGTLEAKSELRTFAGDYDELRNKELDAQRTAANKLGISHEDYRAIIGGRPQDITWA